MSLGVSCSVGHYINICSWVSSCCLQKGAYQFTLVWLFRLAWLVAFCLAFSMALHCFLVSLSMYLGLFLSQFYFLTFVLFCASDSISSWNFSLSMWSSSFFIMFYDMCRCFSSGRYSCIICYTFCFHRLCSLYVVRFTSEFFYSLCILRVIVLFKSVGCWWGSLWECLGCFYCLVVDCLEFIFVFLLRFQPSNP